MSSIELEPYRPEMATEASLMLARAFASNPLHLAAFGDSVLTKNEVFFRTVLRLLKGPKVVATDGSQILGLIHWVHSSECQVSGAEKNPLTPHNGLEPRCEGQPEGSFLAFHVGKPRPARIAHASWPHWRDA